MDIAESRAAHKYREAAGASYHSTLHSLSPAAEQLLSADRARKFAPWIDQHARVVEFGVGPGWNLTSLQCESRLGVDVATVYDELLRSHGIGFVTESSLVADASCDVVLCHHMLEHVTHPADVLAEAQRVLTPGGRLLLFVPYESIRRYRKFDPAEKNMHLFSWNAQTLAALAAECGLEVEEARVQRFGYDRFAAEFAARRGWGGGIYRAIRRLLLTVRPIREVCVVAGRPSS